MAGDALPDIAGMQDVRAALQSAGFVLLEAHGRASESDPETPRYRALQARDFTLSSIPRTPFGRALANWTLLAAEGLGVFPKGSRAVSTMLNKAADALVERGRYGIFSPMFFVLACKPHSDKDLQHGDSARQEAGAARV